MIIKKLKYKGFDGHIILLCKNHYEIKKDLIESLKMIWAIRCGYNYEENNNDSLPYICNSLFEILKPTIKDYSFFQRKLHEYLFNEYIQDDRNTKEKLIYFYCCEIANLQVKYKKDGDYVDIIELPKPKKDLFNKILKGEGFYEDFYKIEE